MWSKFKSKVINKILSINLKSTAPKVKMLEKSSLKLNKRKIQSKIKKAIRMKRIKRVRKDKRVRKNKIKNRNKKRKMNYDSMNKVNIMK